MARRRSGGLRGRLDRLEGNAHATMGTAQGAIIAVREATTGLLEDFQDGFTLRLVNTGEGTVMDFLMGRIKELPLAVRIEVAEEPPACEEPPA